MALCTVRVQATELHHSDMNLLVGDGWKVLRCFLLAPRTPWFTLLFYEFSSVAVNYLEVFFILW